MGLITIYTSPEMTISIDEIFPKLLELKRKSSIVLDQEDREEILDMALQYLLDTGYVKSLRGSSVITTSDIPLLNKKIKFFLQEEFGLFEDAMEFLHEYCVDLKDSPINDRVAAEEVETLISQYYQEVYNVNCILHFFDEKCYGVSGFLSLVKDSIIVILLFDIDEDSYNIP